MQSPARSGRRAARVRRGWIALCVLTVVGAVGCARDEWLTAYRLERSLAVAAVYPTATVLDLGTATARAQLIEGWSWDESNSEGTTFAWSNGRSSTWGMFVFDPAPSSLVVEALSFGAPDAPPQTVRLSLNDREVGTVAITPTFATVRLDVPGNLLHTGWNVFRADYAWTRSDLPSQEGTRWRRGRRDLAVAWNSIALEDSAGAPLVAARETGAEADLVRRELTLLPDTLVEFEVELEPGTRISSGLRCADCRGGARVDVLLGRAGDPRLVTVGSLTDDGGSLPLDIRSPGTYLVDLRSRASAALVLAEPVLERPSPAP